MCETFALITPSDGSPGLMAAICVCCGTRLKHRQSWQAGRNKRMGGIKSKKFINNSPCPLESCCLFNNAWPPQVSLPALTQMQRALWVNMETREEDKPDPLNQTTHPRGAPPPTGTTTPPSAFPRWAERPNDEREISQMTDGLPEPGRRFDKTSEKQSAGIIIQLMHN